MVAKKKVHRKKRPSIDDYMTVPQVIDFLELPKATVYYWLKVNELRWEWFGQVKIVLEKDAILFKKRKLIF